MKIKRRIPIHKIGGVSKTTVPGKNEFTIHVPTEYDYRFISERYKIGYILIIIFRREEIIEFLKFKFMEKMQTNLPIFGIQKTNLREFTTTEKDMKKLVSKFPPS